MSHNSIGVIGLGTMGLQLILNFRDHTVPFEGYDPSAERRRLFKQQAQQNAQPTIEQLIESLPTPRTLLLLIPDQSFTEDLLRKILRQLEPQDILIDAGNSHYRRTERFQQVAKEEERQFIGMGISGGAAIMLGGKKDTMERVLPLLSSVAATAEDGRHCITAVGPGGAGHFVKMVHNGIEYAEMQILAEIWLCLQHLCNMPPKTIAQQFRHWLQQSPSFLLECATEVLEAETADVTGNPSPLIHQIMDRLSEKGTGRWTVSAALEYGVPVPSIAEAVFARYLSQQIHQPTPFPSASTCNPDQIIEAAHATLTGARISTYAQGFSLIQQASQQEGWEINRTSLARGWRAGCIIRGQLINEIASKLESIDNQSDLFSIPSLNQQLHSTETDWHNLLQQTMGYRIPTPAISSALNYYHDWQSSHLGADLIQGMRDNFGSHGFEKIGPQGTHHHSNWPRNG